MGVEKRQLETVVAFAVAVLVVIVFVVAVFVVLMFVMAVAAACLQADEAYTAQKKVAAAALV